MYPILLLCWLRFSIYISYVNLEPHWVLKQPLCYVNIEPHTTFCNMGLITTSCNYVRLEPHCNMYILLCSYVDLGFLSTYRMFTWNDFGSYVDLGFLSTNPMLAWNHIWSWNIFLLCQHRTTYYILITTSCDYVRLEPYCNIYIFFSSYVDLGFLSAYLM